MARPKICGMLRGIQERSSLFQFFRNYAFQVQLGWPSCKSPMYLYHGEVKITQFLIEGHMPTLIFRLSH